MMQQPVSGSLDVTSPITFPEDTEDPRVTPDSSSAGGLWGFIKVLTHCNTSITSYQFADIVVLSGCSR